MMAHRVLAATADAVTRVEDIPEKLKPYTSTIAVVVILLGLLLAFSGKRALKVRGTLDKPLDTIILLLEGRSLG